MLALAACGGTRRGAAAPQVGKTTLTGAEISPTIERLVVAELGAMSMVSRETGCIATLKTSEMQAGTSDELRVRCPKADRIKMWFEGVDRVTGDFTYEPVRRNVDEDAEDGDEPLTLPAAKVVTASGKMMKIVKKADVDKLAHEVRTLNEELASTEEPAPGPTSASGWQMLHVAGAAHVMFAGHPARGVFEARVSTNGQYLCEFVTNNGDGPLRATKSGWIAPQTASRAIDEVLGPFNPALATERPKTTYAAAVSNGAEKRSNVASTAAVFERFTHMQEALGDACLPELEAPSSGQIGL